VVNFTFFLFHFTKPLFILHFLFSNHIAKGDATQWSFISLYLFLCTYSCYHTCITSHVLYTTFIISSSYLKHHIKFTTQTSFYHHNLIIISSLYLNHHIKFTSQSSSHHYILIIESNSQHKHHSIFTTQSSLYVLISYTISCSHIKHYIILTFHIHTHSLSHIHFTSFISISHHSYFISSPYAYNQGRNDVHHCGDECPPKSFEICLKIWKFINLSPQNNFFVPPNFIYIYIFFDLSFILKDQKYYCFYYYFLIKYPKSASSSFFP